MPKSPHDFHNFSLQNTKKSQTKDLSFPPACCRQLLAFAQEARYDDLGFEKQ